MEEDDLFFLWQRPIRMKSVIIHICHKSLYIDVGRSEVRSCKCGALNSNLPLLIRGPKNERSNSSFN